MRNRAGTLFLMAVLTVLFVWVGGILGGRQGAIIAFSITEQSPNAFATGRNPRHAAVAATQGLLTGLGLVG